MQCKQEVNEKKLAIKFYETRNS